MNQPLNLMPFQDLPFNADYFICEKVIELVNKHKINFVIETGTCVGGTTDWFASPEVFNFKKIFTIEVNALYQTVAKQHCADNDKNIEFILGDSSHAINQIYDANKGLHDASVLFYLDAHWENHCPLRDELNQIAQNCRKSPVIVIHDFKVPNRPDLGYDIYGNITLELAYIEDLLPAIYGENGYQISYNPEQSVGAKRGVLFIEPKL